MFEYQDSLQPASIETSRTAEAIFVLAGRAERHGSLTVLHHSMFDLSA